MYERLLAVGVRIWEYGPTLLHAKTMTVDGAWSSVGSVNFDNRSFQLHDEATLCVQSHEFAERLTAQFETDLGASEEIRPSRWRERPVHQRASSCSSASAASSDAAGPDPPEAYGSTAGSTLVCDSELCDPGLDQTGHQLDLKLLDGLGCAFVPAMRHLDIDVWRLR